MAVYSFVIHPSTLPVHFTRCHQNMSYDMRVRENISFGDRIKRGDNSKKQKREFSFLYMPHLLD